MLRSSIAAVLQALAMAFPATINCDTPNCALIAAGGRTVQNTGVQLTGNGASVENVFKVTGPIRILQVYAICTAEAEAPNTTFAACKFVIWDGANTVDMTAIVAASGIEPNDMLIKLADDGTALVWMDADAAGIYAENATQNKSFGEGIANQKTGTDTFIRFHYTGDGTTDVTLTFYVRWQPLSDTSAVVAV